MQKIFQRSVLVGGVFLMLVQAGCGGRKPDTKLRRMRSNSKAVAILPAAAAGLVVAGPFGLLVGIVAGCVTGVACSGGLYTRRLRKALCKLETCLLDLDSFERRDKKLLLADAKELEKEFTRLDKQAYRKRASDAVTQLQGALKRA